MTLIRHVAFQPLLAFCLQSPCAWRSRKQAGAANTTKCTCCFCNTLKHMHCYMPACRPVHKGCRAAGRPPSSSVYNGPRFSCMACSSQETATSMVPGTCFVIHGSGQRTLTKSSYSYLLRAMLQSSPPSKAEKLPGLCGRLSKPIFQPLPSDSWKSCGAAAVCVSVLCAVLPDRLPVCCTRFVKSNLC